MEIKQLKALIEEKLDCDAFRDSLSEESITVRDGDAKNETLISELLGLSYEFLETERDYERMYWRFKIDGVVYQLGGSYDSWAGQEMDRINSFYEVSPVQRTVTEWRAV